MVGVDCVYVFVKTLLSTENVDEQLAIASLCVGFSIFSHQPGITTIYEVLNITLYFPNSHN